MKAEQLNISRVDNGYVISGYVGNQKSINLIAFDLEDALNLIAEFIKANDKEFPESACVRILTEDQTELS